MIMYFKKAVRLWQHEGWRVVLQRIWQKLWLKLRTGRWTTIDVPREDTSAVPPIVTPPALQVTSQLYPDFSVLVYVHSDKILNCLYYLQEHLVSQYSMEVMVMLDGTPPHAPLLAIGGIQILYSPHPIGEVAAWNYLAKKARGKYLIFMDDRSQVAPQYLPSLLPIAAQGHGVGPKINSEYRQLLSAGVVVSQESILEHFGAQDFPGEPEYNYVRPAEALSPLGFLMPTPLYHQVQGFNEKFSDGTYAMADFCYRLRAEGHQVVYQPKSLLIYRDVVLSSGQPADRVLWQQLWGKATKAGKERKFVPKPTILIIDTLVPAYDKESGAFRLYQIMQIMLRQGYSVIFLPDYGHEQEPYTSELESLGIEVLYFTYQQSDWKLRLERRLADIDLAWVCRPELCEKYFPVLQHHPKIKLLYDTIDLHFLRLQREEALNPAHPPTQEWKSMQRRELACARQAQATLVVTPVEQGILAELGVDNSWVIPNIHPIYGGEIPGHPDRQGLLFIGGYFHAPNVDAVQWLCQAIMPLIWQTHPAFTLTLLGSHPPKEVMALANDRVTVPGYVRDVAPYFLSRRIFIAPLRFGAGMKGKVGHSLSFGLPVVTTPIGAEGIGLEHHKNVLIASSPADLAACVIQLDQDPLLWQKLSGAARAFMQQYAPQSVEPQIAQLLQQFSPRKESL